MQIKTVSSIEYIVSSKERKRKENFEMVADKNSIECIIIFISFFWREKVKAKRIKNCKLYKTSISFIILYANSILTTLIG